MTDSPSARLHLAMTAASQEDEAGNSSHGPCGHFPAGRSPSYHAFGLIGTTFRELGWKMLIFFERAVPMKERRPAKDRLCGPCQWAGNIEAPGAPGVVAAKQRVLAATVRCPLCEGYAGRFGRGRAFRMHLLSSVHQVCRALAPWLVYDGEMLLSDSFP